MRKFNFYSIVALVGAMVLSVSSCTKDLEDDVDALKKEVAANKDAIKTLQDAISSGGVITKIDPVAGGFLITLSNGKTIDLKHGNDGAPGGNGSAGVDGVDGFAPVLGVDSEGYWTVITTKGGTATRIEDVNGDPVLAKGTNGSDAVVSVTDDGFLKIGDTVTAIGISSSVILNPNNGTALITMWDSVSKTTKQFTVPVIGEGGVVASLRTPLSEGFVLTVVQGKAGATFVDGPFAGAITKDDVLINGVLPVIVNPSNANVLPVNFSLENAKGETLDVQFTKAVKGYDGLLDKTKAATAVNGITTLTVAASSTNKEIIASTSNLALKYAFAGESAIYSTYDYTVKTGAPTDLTTTSDATAVKKIGTPIVFNGKTTEGALYQIDPADIYKQKITLHSESQEYASYFDFGADGNTVTSKKDAKALVGKSVKFVYSILDYNGACKGYTAGKYTEASATVVTVVFYDSNLQPDYSLLPITHALSSTAKTSTSELSTLFSSLGTDNAAYWKANAKTFTYKYFEKDEKGEWVATTDILNARLLKADGKTATTTASEAAKLEVTIDETKALPTNTYKVEMSYVDGSLPLGKETFVINTEVKVTNPKVILYKKTALFNGDKLTIYGDAQGTPLTNSYLLTNAYNKVTDVALTFAEIGEDDVLTPIASDKVMIPTSAMNNPINVKVTGTLFGNVKNTVSENIVVTPKSSIATGSMTVAKDKLKLTYDKTLTGAAAKVELSKLLTMYDAETNLVNFLVVTGFDSRLKPVSIVAEGSNKDLILITPDTNTGEQTVTIVYTTQNIPSEITIPIRVTLTDKYDQTYEEVINFKIEPKKATV